MPRTTIKDVASEAAVSIATVSAVVNDADWVSAPTRDRVQATIDRLGYRPNRVARTMRTRRGDAVGVIVSDLTNPYFAEVVRGLQHRLREHGRSLLLADTNQQFEEGGRQFDLLLDKQVDGFVFFGDSVPESVLAAHVRRRSRVPIVTVGRDYGLRGVATVLANAETAAFDAVSHLAERGYRRIAHVTGPVAEFGATTHGASPRLAGYRRALAEAGLDAPDEYVVHGDWRAEGGAVAAVDLLSLPQRPDAVFCGNDLMAFGLMRAARVAGLDVPTDLAVVGFDDVPTAALVHPALTTCAMPKAALGHAAADLLQQLLDGGSDIPDSPVFLDAPLVVRASTPARA
ncbi:MAG: LacI family DNA-binding transcriptional regulator [Bacteroidota bacterium]